MGRWGRGWLPPSLSHPMLRPLLVSQLLVPHVRAFGEPGGGFNPRAGILEGCRPLSPSMAGTRPHPVPTCGRWAVGDVRKARTPSLPVAGAAPCHLTAVTPLPSPPSPGFLLAGCLPRRVTLTQRPVGAPGWVLWRGVPREEEQEGMGGSSREPSQVGRKAWLLLRPPPPNAPHSQPPHTDLGSPARAPGLRPQGGLGVAELPLTTPPYAPPYPPLTNTGQLDAGLGEGPTA